MRKAAEQQTKIDALRQQIYGNVQRIELARKRIEQLNKELGRQEGTGGSAYDPDTGRTTEAWTQADGRVKITVKDKDGNIIEERIRERRDSAKIRAEIAKEEANIKALEKERKKLDSDREYDLKLQQSYNRQADVALS